ncbi:MAG: hypothetical protein OSJ43_11670 [Oscillospiraceae bacterium]|nr:hypothetical protein [Oscillospiraceae bacterium]
MKKYERTVRAMDRLTARIDGYSHGKCGRNLDIALKNKSYNRGCFECTAIIERLCEYEDTGLTPEEITAMKADNKRLHEPVDTV